MKLALVCSHGGHLTEMMVLSSAFEGHERFWVTSRSTRTVAMAEHDRVFLVPHAGMNPVLNGVIFVKALFILVRERPDAVITTGAEIAVPFAWLGKLLGIRVVYVESWCRLRTRSGTGPLVYPAADVFLVQWPMLLEAYGDKARYEGGLI
jgi:UDP-N-acetylglucosamine:LPS N-acetylglucosamine transferase